MFNTVTKIFKICTLSIIGMFYMICPAFSQEITAINFNGDLIGKVIPDGTVVSFDNEIIGNITADSFIVNGKGEIIGGIIPQGVAIGNDNKPLGKVNNDGSVRLPSGKIVGKVLPNGLIVDDDYNILGGVLYPGLVYNDEGKTVGRLTGDGLYISIEGQNIGFVSALGYAYRNNGNGFVLDGKLISSKMVVSPSGDFIGSITPGGTVTDFDSKPIGRIHANGYAYSDAGKVIGKVVSNGYAFDNYGKYLGLVTYNGEVLLGGDIVGKLRADDKIVNLKGEVIGFKIDIAATCTDLNGQYLGRIMPGGEVVKAKEKVGIVGARGNVLNKDGEVIGYILQAGPVFDYAGELKAQILRSGSVNTVTGSPLGYAKLNRAYDNIGRMIGSSIVPSLVVDNSNTVLGISGVGSEFNSNNRKYKVSPFGYVYSSDNLLMGNAVALDAVYNLGGEISAYLGVNGELQGIAKERGYKLKQFGLVADADNNAIAWSLSPLFAQDEQGKSLGMLSQTNLVLDKKRSVTGKVVPGSNVVSSTEKVNNRQVPVVGGAGSSFLAVGINGDILGYADFKGDVTDYSGNKIGTVSGKDTVINSGGSIIGNIIDFKGVVNDKCSYLGTIDYQGNVRNSRGVVLGNILSNNQVVSEVGDVIGFGVGSAVIADFDGKILGSTNTVGHVLNYKNENIGCIRYDGRLYSAEGKYLGRKSEAFPVMSFENIMLGRSNINNEVISSENKKVGYIDPEGSAISDSGEILGLSFRYKVAFDNDNTFLGRVLDNGTVISDKNDILGTVEYDGTVTDDGEQVGYALYDLYIYNEEGKVIGYLNGDGRVSSFSGSRLGKVDRGFLINKDYEIIGRGNRDYFIRDGENKVIGELSLKGEVIDKNGQSIGKLSGNGDIVDNNGNVLATAHYLQYYNAQKPEPAKPAEWAGAPKVKLDAVPVAQDTQDSKYGLKTIGIALTPDGNYLGDILSNNDVIDKLGNLLGKKMPDGLIVDNEGGLIGIEEVKNVKGGQMFVPAGTFGSGGAYGTGNNPVNLGPGGGFGPGERYDPVRSQALAMAQNARREEIKVGQLSTNVDKESFDGKQAYWDGVPKQLSSWRVDMSEMILADKPIPAVLARTIMSSGGADNVPVTAIVERNVYAEVGRNIVIPAGSRVMGTSSGGSGGGTSGGAVRVSITWTRLIRPDGSAFEFSAAQTGDAQGRGGALGYLDEQLMKKYTLPMVTNLLSSAVAYVAASGETTTNSDGDSVESARQEAAQDARENFLDNMDQMFDQILQDKTDIEAVTYVPAGTRLIIYPKEDLWIRTPERSAEESLQAAKKPTVFLDDSDPTDSKERRGAAAQGGGSTGTGTEAGTSGVVYTDEDSATVQSTPLLDDPTSTNKNTNRQPTIPPVTSTGATPPPPSSTAGANNTSAQLF